MDSAIPPDAIDDESRDPLTGLAGIAFASDWLDRNGAKGFVHAMLLGLHRFRSVNLAYGQSAGDIALVELAQRIRIFADEEIGGDTLVARVGGGDFLVASAGKVSRERWQWLAEALARRVSRVLPLRGEELQLAPRIALLRGQPGEGGPALLDRLDQALTSLQQQPARRLQWADGSHLARGRSAARLEADMIGAMARDEIGIVFQPQYAVAGGDIVGVEALARWDHPQLGRIGAETLFALAERGDHVAQVSRHIAGRAMWQAVEWKPVIPLSLNITAEDLGDDRLVEDCRLLLAQTGYPPSSLTVEVTEHALIADFERSAAALEQLARLGVRIALDDFGAGYANFRTLKALPVNTLKLDASLVRDIDRDPRDRAILRAIVAMARALGQKVVVEGIERESQLQVLAAEGCDAFQGFLRSGPIPADQIAALSR